MPRRESQTPPGHFCLKSQEEDMLPSHWDASYKSSKPTAALSHPCCHVGNWLENEINTKGSRAEMESDD